MYSNDLKTDAQPTYATMALPSNWNALTSAADRFDTCLHVTKTASRLLLTGSRTGDGHVVIWECTNWTSIYSNPSPPAATWVERVVYDTTTIGGSTVTQIGSLTEGQADFDRNDILFFSCRLGGSTRLGKIAQCGDPLLLGVQGIDQSAAARFV